MQEQASSGHMETIIRIRCIFCTTIRPNTNTLLGLLFSPNNTNRIFSTALFKNVANVDCHLHYQVVRQSS